MTGLEQNWSKKREDVSSIGSSQRLCKIPAPQELERLLPETARKYGARDLEDPAEVAAAGARYLKHLLVRYDGDVAKSVTAYSCGEVAMDSGTPGAEAIGYRNLVMEVLGAKAVQPAAPIEQACVEGTVRVGKDGISTLNVRVSHSGNMTLRIKRLDKDGKPEEATATTVKIGALISEIHGRPGDKDYKITFKPDVIGSKAKGPWGESNPRVTMDFPKGSELLVQCESPEGGVKGETQLSLDGDWKTFAFKMDTPFEK